LTPRELIQKARTRAEQFYTPKQIQALVFWMAVGMGVLLYRGGGTVYRAFVPEASPEYLASQRRTDSLFRALSSKVSHRDSLRFSIDASDTIALKASSSFAIRSAKPKKEDNLSSAEISLNKSGRMALMKLPSVGEATADLILAYRTERGRFRTLAELKNVRGIGEKRFARMKPFLKLD
jgi:competence ComEA-like helix-hairpin-helix protein